MIISLPVDIIRATEGEFHMEKYDFGNKLYEYRTQKGLTQKELSRLFGVMKKTVSKWENGESKPRRNKMAQITMLFETDIDGGMLANEASENGEQLKPHKTILDSQLKIYSICYKAVRIWTYICAIICMAYAYLKSVKEVLNGGIAFGKVSYRIAIIILTSAAVIFTAKFKSRFSECKYKDMNIFMGFISALLFAAGVFLVISFVKTGRIIGEYNSAAIGIICIEALILAVIAAVSLLKKRYTAFVIAVCIFSLFNIFELSSLYYFITYFIAAQLMLFIDKRKWLSLAEKADIEIKKSSESQKAANIFTAIVAIIAALGIAASYLSPYITYKICLKKYPLTYMHNEVIEHDYSAEFDEEFTEIEFAGAKIKIPEGYEKINENHDEFDDSVYYKNAQNDIIQVSYFPNEKDSLYLDESDLEDLDPDEADELREHFAKEKIMDSLYKKYYGVSSDTYYGMQYVNYFVDVEDVKFYETQKAALALGVHMTRMLSDTGTPMSVSKFDDGMYCGLICGRQMKLSDKTNAFWTAEVWHSNNKEGESYSITFCDRNSSDITDNQMICKLINSLEF